MGMLDSMLNWARLERLVEASLSEVMMVMAGMAAHDNRMDFEEEVPELVVEGELVREVVVVEK